MEFIEISEIDQRGIRRLAQSRGTVVTKVGVNSYRYNSVQMTDDELWGVLRGLPQTQTLGGKGRNL